MREGIRMGMTPEEEAIATEFEAGWSEEKIAAATLRLGPAAHTLPDEVREQLQTLSHDDASGKEPIDARLTKDGEWWVAEFVVDGRELGTQARELAEIPEQVADAAALLTGRGSDELEVHVL